MTTYKDSSGRVLLTPWEAMHLTEVRRRFRVGASPLDCSACSLLDWLGTTMRPGADEPRSAALTEQCRGNDGPCLRLALTRPSFFGGGLA